jgi:hypothetical protein
MYTEGFSFLFSVALQSQKMPNFLHVWKKELNGATGDHTARPMLTSLASFREDQACVSVELGCYSATYLCVENLKNQHSFDRIQTKSM